MKILFDCDVYRVAPVGGIARTFWQWIKQLCALDDSVDITMYARNRVKCKPPGGKGIKKMVPWRSGVLIQSLEQWYIHLRLMTGNYDIFQATYYGEPPAKCKRYIVTVYDFIDDETVSSFSFNPSLTGNAHTFKDKQKEVIRQADGIVAISESTRKLVIKYCSISPDRVRTIPLAASAPFTDGPAESDESQAYLLAKGIDKPYWLHVGGRHAYKNFGLLLRAFSLYAQDHVDDLVLVGPAQPFSPWQIDFILRNKLAGRIKVLCGIADRELHFIYSGAVGFVSVSASEGFGIPLVESMSSGTPMILSDIPVYREVAGNAALFVAIHDVEALAGAMDRMSGNLLLREKLIMLGLERAQRFSWHKSTTMLYAFYHDILNMPKVS